MIARFILASGVCENEIPLSRRQGSNCVVDRVDEVPDCLRKLGFSVGFKQAEDWIVDPMIVRNLGFQERRQLSCNRQLAGAGKADQIDNHIREDGRFSLLV